MASSGITVHKYGGTSVGSPERILRVAERIAIKHQEGTPLVIVVSAMGDTTDELLNLAHQVNPHPPHREMDMLLSTGERVSMALLSMALSKLGVTALSFTGSQTGIITDESHRDARILRILGDRVRECLNQNKVAIVAGFQGVSEKKEITTLGRGGSDTTAVALGVSLGASVCDIFTDVDGVFSADPRKVEKPKFISKISQTLMLEMARLGAGVLHARSVGVALKYGLPLTVKNSLLGFELPRFTEVLPYRERKRTEQNMESQKPVNALLEIERSKVHAVVSDPSVMGVEITLSEGGEQALLAEFAAQKICPTLTHLYPGGMRVLVARKDLAPLRRSLEELQSRKNINKFNILEDICSVSVVGDFLGQDSVGLMKVMAVLKQNQIQWWIAGGNSLSITVGVSLKQEPVAVRLLHSLVEVKE